MHCSVASLPTDPQAMIYARTSVHTRVTAMLVLAAACLLLLAVLGVTPDSAPVITIAGHTNNTSNSREMGDIQKADVSKLKSSAIASKTEGELLITFCSFSFIKLSMIEMANIL